MPSAAIWLPYIAVYLSVLLLVGAALHDLAFRTVPDWISGFLVILAGFIHSLHGDLLHAAGISGLIFSVSLFLWLQGWMGGGDVKLMAAAGFLLPPAKALPFVFMLSILGGVLAALYLILSAFVTFHRHPSSPTTFFARVLRAERWRISRRGPLPYAVAISGSAIILFI